MPTDDTPTTPRHSRCGPLDGHTYCTPCGERSDRCKCPPDPPMTDTRMTPAPPRGPVDMALLLRSVGVGKFVEVLTQWQDEIMESTIRSYKRHAAQPTTPEARALGCEAVHPGTLSCPPPQLPTCARVAAALEAARAQAREAALEEAARICDRKAAAPILEALKPWIMEGTEEYCFMPDFCDQLNGEHESACEGVRAAIRSGGRRGRTASVADMMSVPLWIAELTTTACNHAGEFYDCDSCDLIRPVIVDAYERGKAERDTCKAERDTPTTPEARERESLCAQLVMCFGFRPCEDGKHGEFQADHWCVCDLISAALAAAEQRGRAAGEKERDDLLAFFGATRTEDGGISIRAQSDVIEAARAQAREERDQDWLDRARRYFDIRPDVETVLAKDYAPESLLADVVMHEVWKRDPDVAQAREAALEEAARIADDRRLIDRAGGSTGNAFGTQINIVAAIRAAARATEPK